MLEDFYKEQIHISENIVLQSMVFMVMSQIFIKEGLGYGEELKSQNTWKIIQHLNLLNLLN